MKTRAKILVLAFAVSLPHTLADEAQRRKGAAEAVKQAALARQQGDPARATRILEASLAACGGDARCQAVAELGLGLNARATGSLELALAHYQKALRLARAATDPDLEAAALANHGVVYNDLGEKTKAFGFYEDALHIFQTTGDRSGEATTLNGIGVVYSDLGQKRKALEYCERALPLFRAAGDAGGEAKALDAIGRVHSDLGEKQKALEVLEQALPIRQVAGDRTGEATTLANIGAVYSDLGERRKALDYFERALPVFHAAGDRNGESATLNNIGLVESNLGERQKALEHYQQALPILKAVGNRSGEATMLNNIGLLYSDLGEKAKAVEFYEQALPILRAVGYRTGEARVLQNLASAVKEKSSERAILHSKQAVNILQSLRADAPEQSQRAFAGSVSGTYRFLADLLAGEARIVEAHQVMDLLREDEVGRLLQRGEPTGSRIGLDSREAALDGAYRALADALAPLTSEAARLRRRPSLSADDRQRLVALDESVLAGRAKLTEFFAGIAEQLARAGVERVRRGEARENAALAELLPGLPSGTVAVYTIAGETSLKTILYTQDRHAVGEAPVTYPDLAKAVFELRQALSDPRMDVEAAGARLYDLLVAPIADELERAKAKTVMWSLDGPLRYVPMAVLRDARAKAWLVERFRNVVITTASHTRLGTAPVARWSALGLGVTKAHEDLQALAGVEAELAAVVRDGKSPGGALPGRRLLDGAFTLEAMERELKEHRPVLHIASHYVFEPPTDRAAANGSYLLIGDGSHLTLKDLDGMPDGTFRGVDLVTLSACDTAMGADRAELEGAEVDGLAFVAQQKGARSVLATLWRVADASTTAFMAEFYRRRAAGATTKAEALQAVQLAFLSRKVRPGTGTGARGGEPMDGADGADWTHPYFWAPFILIGNWR